MHMGQPCMRGSARCSATRKHNGRACPPQYTQAEWTAFRDNNTGENVLVHTDGSRCYQNVDEQKHQLHDAVVHSYRGKGRSQHVLPDGSTLQATAGTCALDGWWRTAKKSVDTTNRTNNDAVNRKVRLAQWATWNRGTCAGKKISQALFVD